MSDPAAYPPAAQEVPVVVGQTLKVLAATRARQAGVAVPAAAVVRNAANETVGLSCDKLGECSPAWSRRVSPPLSMTAPRRA